MINWDELGKDYQKDAIQFAIDLQKANEENDQLIREIFKLSSALCDMLFIYTCFDEYCKDVPEDLYKEINSMAINARLIYCKKT